MRRTNPCASFYLETVKHRQGQTSVNRCVEGKTRVFREHAWVVDRQTISKGLDNRGNQSTRAIVQTGANTVQKAKR